MSSLVALAFLASEARGQTEATPATTSEASARPARVMPDAAKLSQAGIRKLAGKHLTLYTDLPSDQEVDNIPALFDQGVRQLCDYLGVDRARVAGWKLTGYLMRNPTAFESLGLIDRRVPSFDHGYSIDDEFWLYEQPSPYYRRHLLLHESTHAFMNELLGGCGPAWFMEGIAELLATHRVKDGHLTLRVYPRTRDEVPLWGRIKLVQDNVRERRMYTVREMLALAPGADRTSDGYAWTWALAAFLDGHPRYQERFRQLPKLVTEDNFNGRFEQLFADDWRDLELEWRLFIGEIDFEYDLARAAIRFDAPADSAEGAETVSVAADRGWQSSGFVVEPGQTYRITATGRYEVAREPRPWVSEPNGVSIQYYRGRPVGQLLAAVRPDEDSAADAKSFLDPISVGLGTRIRSSKRGTLYFRINDSPTRLADNHGQAQVRIEPE